VGQGEGGVADSGGAGGGGVGVCVKEGSQTDPVAALKQDLREVVRLYPAGR
jgi:hypothetical protein